MDDVGTRLQFLTELYELWQTGIDILDRYDKDATNYIERRAELVHAVNMLWYHMRKDYEAGKDIKAINEIPKAEYIKDEPKTE